MSLFFNFHGLVELEIDTQDKQTLHFFSEEYKPYQVDRLLGNTPRVFLRFQRKPFPSTTKGYSVSFHKLFANWAYHINILDENLIEIDVYGNLVSIAMVHHMLVHPSIRYLSSMAQVLMLHAGAVTYQQKSWLFTGYGGAGKTTTTSLLLKALGTGKFLHSDDYVFFDPTPKTYSYLTRSHLYWDLVRWLPALKEILTTQELVRLWVLGKIRKYSHEGVKWPVRIGFERMWTGYAHVREAIPAGVIWLERSTDGSVSLDPFDPTEDDLDNLIEMNFYEARHFLSLIQKNSSVQNYEYWLSAWQARERELLKDCFTQTQSYRLKISHISKNTSFLKDLVTLIKA